MDGQRYFTVHVSCNIYKARHVPGVCYPLTKSLTRAIEDMASRGEARIFNEPVRIVTGVPLSKKTGFPIKGSRVSQAVPKEKLAPSPSANGVPMSPSDPPAV